ncbi:diaminopimelate decarboxylase [Candidatus Endowatersipora endosymbiont of Watersipora subatra]|uniref:diaminopimelate decarboxylase n=1 Tax=Candidatus Endowatersipora endosymbiont of Watersipora subatra TaxID=3077946 RepID=UPI00312C861F
MNPFDYKDGVFHVENTSLKKIADAIRTPFYCYSSVKIASQYTEFCKIFDDIPSLVCYAIKANSNQAVLRILARLGAGADIVSEGELRRARAAFIPAEKIIFSGVGKTIRELDLALVEDILCFNVESEPELELLSSRAVTYGRKARISFRINPDIDAGTHSKTATGRADDKFGIFWRDAPRVYKKAAQLPGIEVTGIAMHIGSQIIKSQPFDDAFSRLSKLITILRADGHTIKQIDLGGGVGIPYERDNYNQLNLKAYATLVRKYVKNLDARIIFEPGRIIVGNAGILVTEVLYLKKSRNRIFTIIDAAMNDLIRPTLYESWHEIEPVVLAAAHAPYITTDIVGPVCESGDYFAKERQITRPKSGDLLAIRSAGAYGAVQSGTYNSRLLIPEVLVKENHFDVIRSRTSFDDFISLDHIPEWLSDE